MKFSETERESFYRVLRARRDIRQFAPRPLEDEVLRRVLEAGHWAPSVGFMQPWNFLLIRSLELRRQIKASFERVNAAEVVRLEGDRRKGLYGNLKLEGILESPLNIAVTCDRRRDEPFVLGRNAMPETDLYSTCLAVENMWLAARVESVGIGWVSILDRPAVERILGLPEGVRLVAYLCIGYPLEFRPAPLLEEVGWKGRSDLGGLVYEDAWGKAATL